MRRLTKTKSLKAAATVSAATKTDFIVASAAMSS
jgi:hypothetical protein